MPNNIAVIYKSKYGAARTYSKWISDKLHADIFEADNVSFQTLKNYDIVIFAGSLYASKLTVYKNIKKLYKKLKNKKIYCVIVGLGNPKYKEIYEEAVNKNFKPKEKENIKFYFLRGAMDFSKLKIHHALMMLMYRKILASKNIQTEEDKIFLDNYGKKLDFLNKNSISDLVSDIKNYNKNYDRNNNNNNNSQ